MNLVPISLRSSCSGSAAQERNVDTSLAICDSVAAVPASSHALASGWARIEYVTHQTRQRVLTRTILILHTAINKHLGHGNSPARKVRVVVQALRVDRRPDRLPCSQGHAEARQKCIPHAQRHRQAADDSLEAARTLQRKGGAVLSSKAEKIRGKNSSP